MAFSREIEAFIREFVKDLQEDNVAIFAGAGMSVPAGYVDWQELLRDIAEELGLEIEKETDLISLAQYHVNHKRGHAALSKRILEEFSHQAKPTKTHEILASLPVRTYWTTNYDTLIEQSLRDALKVPDVKYLVQHLNSTRPKRDAVVYKMHGDVGTPGEAIIYKQQYETYYLDHANFVTALSGDLISKTFLFIGFSFTDPNLDYVLSRLHCGPGRRNHYCFVRREKESEDEALTKYAARRQALRVEDLKRYGIQAVIIDDYEEVPQILQEIRSRYLQKTVFVSGSAEEFGDWTRIEAQTLIHDLAAGLVGHGFRVVNGFGWGVGSAVINGALATIYASPEKYSEDQLVMRPFPQSESGGKKLEELWEEYRQRMISMSGVSLFLFGNKLGEENKIITANGMMREFEIAVEMGRVPIPIAITGYASKEIWEEICKEPAKYYKDPYMMMPLVAELADPGLPHGEIIGKVVRILQQLSK